jgi:hypothetical protein
MPFKKGEIYRCTDADCGCEITVTQDAHRSKSQHEHRCCCGSELKLNSPKV